MFKKKIYPKGVSKRPPIYLRPWIVHVPNFKSSKVYKPDNTNKWITNKNSSSVQQ